MSKVAFLGREKESVGFKALGFKTYFPQESFPSLEWSSYSLIVLTEEVYEEWQQKLAEIEKGNPHLTFLLVPSSTEKIGLAEKRVRRVLERIVGADILARREA
jgi:vacuolar-type H+-ATPase subunit F/Vma7